LNTVHPSRGGNGRHLVSYYTNEGIHICLGQFVII
jgi:fido (protein-threonine AMPylation protein)